MENLRIAFVKSSVYQDLWVTDITNNYIDIFKTTLMRCPAIGLAEHFSADFIIVKDTDEPPCNINKNVLPDSCFQSMQFSKKLKNPSLPFLDETFHDNVSIDSVSHNVDDVHWDKYNIVICINTCVPSRITNTHSNVLWAYFVGENEDRMVNRLITGYDIILNQDVCKPDLPPFSIGFPYSLVGPFTIENMMHKMGVFYDKKVGIFQEINNTQERPVTRAHPTIDEVGRQCDMPIILHSQNIVENVTRIFCAKFFVKLFGRVIRGNGILEVISAGTLILANKNLIMFHNLIPDECHVENENDVINKINYFENNEVEYERIITMQRFRLQEHYFKGPIENLFRKYNEKKINH
jgi:hypothetical protein